MEEFQSTTHGHASSTYLSYQAYYDLLINACLRYDKTKKANVGKRRNAYNTNIDSTYVDYSTDVIDYVPDSYNGGIDLPLVHSTRSIPFPLGIHPLQDLAILPDHLSDPHLNNLGPQAI